MTIVLKPFAEGHELVVVFEKSVDAKTAAHIINSLPYPGKPGGDTSRGKLYFDAHGDQYVLEVTPSEQDTVIERLTKLSEVFEVRRADRTKVRD